MKSTYSLALTAFVSLGLHLFIAMDLLASTKDSLHINYNYSGEYSISVSGEQDIYTFNGSSGDIILLQMRGVNSSFNPQIMIYDPSDSLIADTWETHFARVYGLQLTTTGLYKIILSEYGNNYSGTYGFSLQKTFDVTGTETIHYGTSLVDTISLYAEIKPYVFDGDSGDKIIVQARGIGSSFQPWFEIYDPLGHRIASRWDSHFSRIDTLSLTIKGYYTICMMEDWGDYKGSYGLSLQSKFNNYGADTIGYNTSFLASLTYTAEIQPYTFEGSAGDKIIVQARSKSIYMDPSIQVYDPSGELIGSLAADDYARIDTMQLSSNGYYTILFMSSNGGDPGPYGFCLQKKSDVPGADTIGYNTSFLASLTYTAEIQPYTFEGTAGDKIIVQARSKSIYMDPSIQVYDPSGELIGSLVANDFARIDTMQLSSNGYYTILFMSSNGGDPGPYAFCLQRTINPPGALHLGMYSSIIDTLKLLAQIKPYTFDIDSPSTINITLEEITSAIEPQLELYGINGSRLFQLTGNPSIDVINFIINQPGQYVLFVLDQGSDEIGSFRLTMNPVPDLIEDSVIRIHFDHANGRIDQITYKQGSNSQILDEYWNNNHQRGLGRIQGETGSEITYWNISGQHATFHYSNGLYGTKILDMSWGAVQGFELNVSLNVSAVGNFSTGCLWKPGGDSQSPYDSIRATFEDGYSQQFCVYYPGGYQDIFQDTVNAVGIWDSRYNEAFGYIYDPERTVVAGTGVSLDGPFTDLSGPSNIVFRYAIKHSVDFWNWIDSYSPAVTPQIEVSPSNLAWIHYAYSPVTHTDSLLVKNTGTDTLVFSLYDEETTNENKLAMLEGNSPGNNVILQDDIDSYKNYLNGFPSKGDANWLEELPLIDTILPGDSVYVAVTFNSTSLAPDLYSADIVIQSNDPGNPSVTVPCSMEVLQKNFTTHDNNNNALQDIPDYDIDVFVWRDTAIAPIEFNIFLADSGYNSASLRLYVYDVDEAGGETDEVYINGHFLGTLSGSSNQWSTNTFPVDLSWLIPGPDGKNLVQVMVDVTQAGWAVIVDWAKIITNVTDTPNAFIRYVALDQTIYHPGDTLTIDTEVDTWLDSMNVIVETSIIDSTSIVVASTKDTIRIDSAANDDITQNLLLPLSAIPGQYNIQTIVIDESTFIIQDDQMTPLLCQQPIPPITVTLTPYSPELCKGDTLLVTALVSGGVPPYDLLWNNGTHDTVIQIIGDFSTNFYLTVTDAASTQHLDSVYVVVHNLPNVSAGSDTLINDGDCATLTAFGGNSWEWATLPLQTTQNITVCPVATTIYQVTAFSEYGCSASDDVIVYVIPPNNQVKIILDSMSICISDTILYSAQAFQLDDFASLSLSLRFDPSLFSFAGITNTNPAFVGGTMIYNSYHDKIQVAFYSASGISVGTGKLFDIMLVPLVQGTGAFSFIRPNIDSTVVADTNGMLIMVDFINGTISTESCAELDGELVYANNDSTELDGNIIYLDQSGSTSQVQATTGLDGHFNFNNISYGTYGLDVAMYTPFGGINASDAMLVLRHFLNKDTLYGIYRAAADVNASGYINSVDALHIARRFVNLSTSFPSGDWLFDPDSLTISSAYQQLVIRALCYGDVDASYVFTKQLPGPDVEYKGVLDVKEGLLNIPVGLAEDAGINALSLVFRLRDENLRLIRIKPAIKEGFFLYSIEDDQVRIAWYSANTVNYLAGSPLFYIEAHATGRLVTAPWIAIDASSDLSDQQGRRIDNARLLLPLLKTDLGDREEIHVSVYPNPFKGSFELEFHFDKMVDLRFSILNSMGENVLHQRCLDPEGDFFYTVHLPDNLKAGAYYLRIFYDTGNGASGILNKKIIKIN